MCVHVNDQLYKYIEYIILLDYHQLTTTIIDTYNIFMTKCEMIK